MSTIRMWTSEEPMNPMLIWYHHISIKTKSLECVINWNLCLPSPRYLRYPKCHTHVNNDSRKCSSKKMINISTPLLKMWTVKRHSSNWCKQLANWRTVANRNVSIMSISNNAVPNVDNWNEGSIGTMMGCASYVTIRTKSKLHRCSKDNFLIINKL
jgi:hypothetical protein